MQDLHSQKIAPLLRVEPGQRVIDACAGAGGKTLHLASLMGGKGKIIALDVHEGKLQELKKRVRRSGASLIEPRWIEGSKTIKRLKGSADAVLLDVPCTGFGVWRRNPDGKWKLRPERIDELVQLQERILLQYSQMVRDGGTLVYATCSIAPVENRKQIDAFLTTAVSQWDIEEELNLSPESGGGDGFYGIRLRHRQK
jgi:16S rRNA (cytosine967-C5)-methyltransferase